MKYLIIPKLLDADFVQYYSPSKWWIRGRYTYSDIYYYPGEGIYLKGLDISLGWFGCSISFSKFGCFHNGSHYFIFYKKTNYDYWIERIGY
jgi:hypothetical protein